MRYSQQIPQLNFNTPKKNNLSDEQDENDQQNSNNPQKQRIASNQHHEHTINDNESSLTKIIKNYILGQTIGQGTFNKVKIATHILTNQKVAIKMIDKTSIQTQADKKRLNLQLKILRKVRHPNIAQLYQILQNKDFIFLVTQNVSRGQLFDHILNNQKLTQFQACKFLQQILDAIEYIHSLGVVHRDLKPENILLDFKFNVKIIDFGLSNIYSKDQLLHSACGSPCYAAPEMLTGKPYDGLKSDIWSAGVILYAMCFGYLPFDNPNTKQLYKFITEGVYDIPDHASHELRQLLSIILEVNPMKRATIDEIRSHAFCKFSPLNLTPGIIVGLSDIPYEQQIEQQIIQEIYADQQLSQEQKQQLKKKLKYSIKFNKHNQLSATYYLILQRDLRVKNQTVLNYYMKKNNLINRYSIAERVKHIYEKKLKQRLQKSRSKREKSSQNKTKYNKSSHKSNKKQYLDIVELYDKSSQKENMRKQRKLKTTNTKRNSQTRQTIERRGFKKTRLNFNQIQLQQKQTNNNNNNKTPSRRLYQIPKNNDNKRENKSGQKRLNKDRARNKSLGSTSKKLFIKNQNHRKQRSPQRSGNKSGYKSPTKQIQKIQQQQNKDKKQHSSRKKRSQSQNAFYNKTVNMRQQQKKRRFERKNNQLKNVDINRGSNKNLKKKSPLKQYKKSRQKY